MERKKLRHPFFVIIGPSGSGKTKVTEAVFPKTYKVISHTTRSIRKGERDGIDYYFETVEQFQSLLRSNAFVEHDFFHGNQYGVSFFELLEKTKHHYAYDVLTFKGFQTIEQQFGSMVIPIFLEVTKENALKRLRTREDNQTFIAEREALYRQEAHYKNEILKYSAYCIIDANQPFELVVEAMKNFVNKRITENSTI